MAVAAKISPSPEARQLYMKMVNKADENMHLSLTNTLALATQRTREGLTDAGTVLELEQEGWIGHAWDGGWLLS